MHSEENLVCYKCHFVTSFYMVHVSLFYCVTETPREWRWGWSRGSVPKIPESQTEEKVTEVSIASKIPES